jgi:hypothetical protein
VPDVAFYSLPRRQPQSLKEEQKREIIQSARKLESKRGIWFIASGSDWRYRAEVYFSPDEVRGRVRRGKALAFKYPTLYDAIVKQPAQVEPFDYVQVGEEPPEKFEPRPQNMPFEMPGGLTLDEIAEIMTRVQADEKLPDDGSFPRQVDHRYPVLEFSHQGESVEIRTGFQEGGLNGIGEKLRFKKEHGKWVLQSIGMWVS